MSQTGDGSLKMVVTPATDVPGGYRAEVVLAGAGGGTGSAGNVGTLSAGNQATGQVTATTTAATLVAARPTRKSVAIKNNDTAITVYIGPATVTAGNGMALKAGESISVDTTALIQVIAASGTPVVSYYDTYY